MMQGSPIPANNVREHSHDLQYQKRRSAQAFRGLAHREEAAWRFELSIEFAEQKWEGEGGAVLYAAP